MAPRSRTKVAAVRTTKSSKSLTAAQVSLKYGFRSGLEEKIAADLTSRGVRFTYEELVISYTKPAKTHKYTPDFVLPNGIIIESKGRFLSEDRAKHLLVKAQYPDLDVRFVFSNSKTKINKRSPTTYAMWCEKNGFQYADKAIPEEWLREPPKVAPAVAK
ncbi:endonuclease I [Ralstonia phage P-PSG-11-1]|uniref:Endonuclease I n=1 Tax=Ralstonia phage P-PSG-11 TaxID=2652430 RepID=A0A5P8D3U2_9CAUD|nr:endonuclease I [Ralstonia phage P-PSG-11]QFP93756.1 endonuclease I [Ralstonia phage P-PSG-11-1]